MRRLTTLGARHSISIFPLLRSATQSRKAEEKYASQMNHTHIHCPENITCGATSAHAYLNCNAENADSRLTAKPLKHFSFTRGQKKEMLNLDHAVIRSGHNSQVINDGRCNVSICYLCPIFQDSCLSAHFWVRLATMFIISSQF